MAAHDVPLVDRARRMAFDSSRRLLEQRRADGAWDAPIVVNAFGAALYVAFARTAGLTLRSGEAEIEAGLLRGMIGQVGSDGGFYKYPGSPSSRSITRLAVLAIRLSLGQVRPPLWPPEWLSPNALLSSSLAAAAAAAGERGERFLRVAPGRIPFERDHEALADLVEAYVTGGPLRGAGSLAGLRVAALLARRPALYGLRGAVQPMFRGLLPACAILLDCVDRRTAAGSGSAGASADSSRLADRIRSSQSPNGGWSYQALFTIVNLMALISTGASLDEDAVTRGVGYLHTALHVSPNAGSFISFMNSDVWTTSAATLALERLPPAILPAGETLASIDWLVANQHGDGGFAFAAGSAHDPDCDSSGLATLTLAVARRRGGDGRLDAACSKGLEFLLARQSAGGGFPSFEGTWVPAWLFRNEFVRYGLLDPPVPDVTARVLTALVALGLTDEHPSVRRGLRFLLRREGPAGGWWSRWWAGYLPATGAVLFLMADLGLSLDRPRPSKLSALGQALDRAVAFVVNHQNPDGGWGETVAADADQACAATGPSTPLRTAMTLAALIHCGVRRDGLVVTRAMEYLLDQATDDGRWTDEQACLTVFPNLFYYAHPVLPAVSSLLALGEFLRERPEPCPAAMFR